MVTQGNATDATQAVHLKNSQRADVFLYTCRFLIIHRPLHLIVAFCMALCSPSVFGLRSSVTSVPSLSCCVQIEFPVAIVDKNIDRKKPETRVAAEAFLQYLFTPTAQQEFMDCGFRSALQAPCMNTVWPRCAVLKLDTNTCICMTMLNTKRNDEIQWWLVPCAGVMLRVDGQWCQDLEYFSTVE